MRHIQNIENLPTNSHLVTIDVTGLYTHIPRDEGVQATREALYRRMDQSVPTEFIVTLLELLNKWNIFEFNGSLYQQLHGTAMGQTHAPDYADIFMSVIDKKILEVAALHGEGVFHIRLMKRFLDDLFFIFTGSLEKLHEFHADINNIHENIKFTMSHTKPGGALGCVCEESKSIPFLDTSLEIKDGKIVSDLYRKPSDRNKYLLPSSAHPSHVTKSTPYSLALRIVRNCTEPEARDRRLQELKEILLARDYKLNIVNDCIRKARAVPRNEALKDVEKVIGTPRPVFVVLYDPRMPSVSNIVKKHWRTMVSTDPYLREVFPAPPLIAYKVGRNLARIPRPVLVRERRILNGMHKCNKNGRGCPMCFFVLEVRMMKATATRVIIHIKGELNCQTKGIIYCITCKRCMMQYIGTSKHSAQTRLSQHAGYIRNKNLSQPTGKHFNTRGHSLTDLSFVILERVMSDDVLLREERESHYIRTFNTKYKGLNIKT